METLPMLRRTFGRFSPPDRQELNRIAETLAGTAAAPEADHVDLELAAGVLTTVRMIIDGSERVDG